MEILKYSEIDLEDTIKRSEQDVNNVLGTVSEILENVRIEKDKAIRKYTEKFDKIALTSETMKVTPEEIEEAYKYIEANDEGLIDVIKASAKNAVI